MRAITRRGMLVRGLHASAGGALLVCGLAACGREEARSGTGAATVAKPPSCVNPDELSDSERSLMAAANYLDISTTPNEACNICALFNAAAADAECGRCDIFQRSVSRLGHCNSWSARSP